MNYIFEIEQRIVRFEAVCPHLEEWKKENKKIVFTNGCFDLVHRGHLDYLAKAAELGDKLIVGLNTDNSVRRLKGNSRPIVDEYSRAFLLASLCFVDAVMLFDEDTPYNLIQTVQPDILAKGADYQIDAIAGADIVKKKGGEIVTLDFLPDFSTSSMIKKIVSLQIE
ncbi:MAG: D-glycero-beta-D-manno-heptose 1-phosphate adenylyltransferase [Lentimicrobiaceae bacterium]|nr:D-glycero-beta-D-manno-heptose 1-phosphate adenylyltransferase [Lentimicrobiaceae bacterium]